MKSDRRRNWISFLVLAVRIAIDVSAGRRLCPKRVRTPSGSRRHAKLWCRCALCLRSRQAGSEAGWRRCSPMCEDIPLDLDIPSVRSDGTLLLGVAFRCRDQVRWEIFAADPDTHSVSRLSLCERGSFRVRLRELVVPRGMTHWFRAVSSDSS